MDETREKSKLATARCRAWLEAAYRLSDTSETMLKAIECLSGGSVLIGYTDLGDVIMVLEEIISSLEKAQGQ